MHAHLLPTTSLDSLIIMLRLSRPIGFFMGLFLGMYTRDSYVYPYPLRVQDMKEDYEKINNNIDGRMAEL